MCQTCLLYLFAFRFDHKITQKEQANACMPKGQNQSDSVGSMSFEYVLMQLHVKFNLPTTNVTINQSWTDIVDFFCKHICSLFSGKVYLWALTLCCRLLQDCVRSSWTLPTVVRFTRVCHEENRTHSHRSWANGEVDATANSWIAMFTWKTLDDPNYPQYNCAIMLG